MKTLLKVLLCLLTGVWVSTGLMQDEVQQNLPTPVKISPLFNETASPLSNLKYHHHHHRDNEFPRPTLNCTDFRVHDEYTVFDNGSIFLPNSNETYDFNTYLIQNGTAVLCAKRPITQEDKQRFSNRFLNCENGHMLLDPDEYKLLENGDVQIDIYSKTYHPGDYVIREYGVLICPPFEEFQENTTLDETLNKFPESFTYVTYAGLLISIVSLILHLAVFCMLSSVRNLPGCCLASLSLSLLIAYICFLTVAMGQTGEECANLGLCVYYFFLTSFFWMNAIAFDVWRSFRSVMKELRISSHRIPWRRFLLYSLYSWVIPGALTVMVKYFDSTDVLPEDFRPMFGSYICWFGQRKALLVFFAVPLIIVMVLNAAFFLDVTYVISRATLKTSQSHEAILKKRFFMFMRLALMMGLMWIIGLIAGYANSFVMWYLFIILNTLQGLFIFVVFSCGSKVRGLLCCGKYKGDNSMKRGSTSVRTISQSATV